jgi:hypothetical protein
VIRTRYDEGTASAEVATSAISYYFRNSSASIDDVTNVNYDID